MGKRKYGSKVRRSKSLYRRRKGGVHKALEIFGIIVLVVGLGTLGYAAGKPILDYITGAGPAATTEGWTPPSGSGEEEGETDVAQSETAPVTEPEPQKPEGVGTGIAYYAPTSALTNKTALTSYLISAEAEGCNFLVLDLKDSVGNVWYKSELEILQGKELLKGEMSLREIYTVFEGSSIQPVVRVSTLMDRSAPKTVEGMSYRFSDDSSNWLDDRAENGGKLWADPTKDKTKAYLSMLTGEIQAAGFTTIMLTNTVYPDMRPYDLGVLSSDVTNMGTRHSSLADIVNICAGTNTEQPILLEMDVLDIVRNYGGYQSTAEVLRSSNKLHDYSVVAVFTKGVVTSELALSDTKTVTIPNDLTGQMEYLYLAAEKNLGGSKLIPCIENENMTDNELTSALEKLADMGYELVMVK